jgi:hypothetical protein
MVIHNLNVHRTLFRPHEAHAVLVVNAYAVLPGAVSFQCFEPIARRDAQIIESTSSVQHRQLAQGWRLDISETFDTLA